MESFLGVDQVAQIFSVSVPTVRCWIAKGKLPAMRLGRRVLFRQEDLEAFAEGNLKPYCAGLSQEKSAGVE